MITLNEALEGTLSGVESLQGTISATESLVGSISATESLVGFIALTESLVGELKGTESLVGEMTIPNVITEADEYEGSYTVTPEISDIQVLETKNKILRDDVTVFKVPVWETSNEYGTTIYIGARNGG